MSYLSIPYEVWKTVSVKMNILIKSIIDEIDKTKIMNFNIYSFKTIIYLFTQKMKKSMRMQEKLDIIIVIKYLLINALEKKRNKIII